MAIVAPVSSAKTIASREPPRPTSENTAATMISAPSSASALGRSPRKTIAAAPDSSGPVPRASG